MKNSIKNMKTENIIFDRRFTKFTWFISSTK